MRYSVATAIERAAHVNRTAFQLPSFAKINWQLHVTGRRPDGYHEIFTVLQTISLSDKLSFELRDDGQFQLLCDRPEIPADETNLVSKAAAALRRASGTTRGATVILKKDIPAQAGLGGGSSNAAVALVGLNRLWDCGLSKLRLRELAAEIGADVPFFLTGGTCAAEGTGTVISPLEDVTQTYLVIVSPNATVSTKTAYEALNRPSLTTQSSTSILARSFAGSDLAKRDQWPLINDFESVIFEIEPEIRRAKQALLESGARDALLAGSGSSLFGVFVDQDAQRRGVNSMRAETGWRVFSSVTLSRAEYLSALNLPIGRLS